jgi:tRNA pseudouridine38-40 synthase
LRLDLGYDGTDFSGWAAQPERRTVQSELESALGLVLRLFASPPRLTVAGRTDAGVHARAQVCHVDLAAPAPDPDQLRDRLNAVLPDDLVVHSVAVAPPGFDARFAAIARRYRYRICDDAAQLDPLRRREVLLHRHALDDSVMQAAAALLLGEHDFAAFCRRREGASTVRSLSRLEITRTAGHVVLDVEADAFCHSMVRSLVGALLAVGEGRRPVDWPRSVLDARERDPAVQVAPPHGLTLEAVRYPPDDELAERARVARAVRPPLR